MGESQLQNIYIPQDIVENIISRLPSKSLMRFKSVCKRWYSTISDPNFHKRELELVFAMVEVSQDIFLYSIDDKATTEAIAVPWDEKYLRPSDKVYASNFCNGMVLICFNGSFFLFNPSTGYFVKVLTLNCWDDLKDVITMGLCYDESNSDYKTVIRLSDDGEFVIVASLKGKRWAEVSFPFYAHQVREGPVVKGRLHWAVRELDDYDYDDFDDDNNGHYVSKVITSFDPIMNTFKVLPSPHTESGYIAIVGVGVLDGCLCMARMDFTNGDVEVIAMKEYGVGESWTTMFVLSNFDVNRYCWNRIYMPGPLENLTPLLITKDGEVLVSTYDGILAYNFEKKSYRKYHDIPIGGNWICRVSPVENIVSPIGYYWDQMEHEAFGDQIKWLDNYWWTAGPL